jgi:hypothetical protein
MIRITKEKNKNKKRKVDGLGKELDKKTLTF